MFETSRTLAAAPLSAADKARGLRPAISGSLKISPNISGKRRRLSRGWRRALLGVLALVLIFAAATAWLLVWPAQGTPARVSAIVLLAGPGNRMPVALRLADEHQAPVLVVSQGYLGYGGPCPPARPGVKVICFDPNPADTLGEAEFVGRLAKQYGWGSVIVVASRPQATRARMLVERCFSGPVYVATASLPLLSWPYQIAYGWGALAKALIVHRSC
jgi:uncharacterized SAM-binding protein YcdF (DUF218 family)